MLRIETPKCNHDLGAIYIPGDEKGMLSVNPETVVEDMAKGYVNYSIQQGWTVAEDIGTHIRGEVSRTRLWLTANNGVVPNDFQIVNNIYGHIKNGCNTPKYYLAQLAVHPNTELRHLLAQNYLLWPNLISKIAEIDDRDPAVIVGLCQSQERILREKRLQDTHFGQVYGRAIKLFEAGKLPDVLTKEERLAALGNAA